MRTIVYIDGFNLYKAILTKTAHKWLDIHELFARHVIRPIRPESEVTLTKFFTARILGRYAKDATSPHRQHAYLIALEKYHPGIVEIIEGKHFPVESEGRYIGPEIAGVTIQRARISRLEEKQTDVNIALNMYRDCAKGLCEQVVLVTNDSDLQPALSMIKEDFPSIVRGLVFPTLERKSAALEEVASWTRHGLHAGELAKCQLPKRIPYQSSRKTKHVVKPAEWE